MKCETIVLRNRLNYANKCTINPKKVKSEVQPIKRSLKVDKILN